MFIEQLIQRTSESIRIGIGSPVPDEKEDEILKSLSFCEVRIFRDCETIFCALLEGSIHGAVRGSLSASPFLEAFRIATGHRPRRLALLSTAEGKPFVFGPVGIDEGGTILEMEKMVSYAKIFSSILGWEAKIAVLSGGREEDISRSKKVAKSIRRGDEVSRRTGARHYHILIEDALRWANCVIAPDGISGNLIYRTLVHLGGGASFGALYFPMKLALADTSRAGPKEEYVGAVALTNIAAQIVAGRDCGC